jgi:Leucine-rich repeat (LRR) protein
MTLFYLFHNFTSIFLQPAWVGSSCLQSLTNLYLSHNCFAIFPEELCLLRSLQVLHLDHNQLIAISASIANLQDLNELVLNNNTLCSLPCGQCCYFIHLLQYVISNCTSYFLSKKL